MYTLSFPWKSADFRLMAESRFSVSATFIWLTELGMVDDISFKALCTIYNYVHKNYWVQKISPDVWTALQGLFYIG